MPTPRVPVPKDRPKSKEPWRVEGMPGGDGPRRRVPFGRRFLWLLFALLALNWVVGSQIPDRESRLAVPYSFFRAQVEDGNVKEISSRGDVIQGEFRRPAKPPASKDEADDKFETVTPTFAKDDELLALLLSQRVVVNAKEVDEGRPLFADLLLFFGPTLLLVGLIVFAMRRAAGGAGGPLGQLGRSKAKRYEHSEQRITFDDVAGIDEAEDELVEIVDFLKNPDKYRRLGAAIPKGVLLSGLPGTGKTLLARAVAGEADVPFFSISASEFVEMIVGVGASRVRDLFDQAKKVAPAIIFIDELDAIGRARGGGGGGFGGHDEREQTLNQILTEMDGFTGHGGRHRARRDQPARGARPGAAAAGPLRPPRRGQPARPRRPAQDPRGPHPLGAAGAPTSTSTRSRRPRPGMVGADLRNLVNEAALLAARRRPHPGGDGRLHRRAREDRPRRSAADHVSAEETRAHRLPRGAATRCWACSSRAPTRCARSRSCRAGARSASPSRARTPTATATTPSTCAAGSSARSAAAPPRRSSTAT